MLHDYSFTRAAQPMQPPVLPKSRSQRMFDWQKAHLRTWAGAFSATVKMPTERSIKQENINMMAIFMWTCFISGAHEHLLCSFYCSSQWPCSRVLFLLPECCELVFAVGPLQAGISSLLQFSSRVGRITVRKSWALLLSDIDWNGFSI